MVVLLVVRFVLRSQMVRVERVCVCVCVLNQISQRCWSANRESISFTLSLSQHVSFSVHVSLYTYPYQLYTHTNPPTRTGNQEQQQPTSFLAGLRESSSTSNIRSTPSFLAGLRGNSSNTTTSSTTTQEQYVQDDIVDEDEEADAENMNTFGVESMDQEQDNAGLSSSFLHGLGFDDILYDTPAQEVKQEKKESESSRLSVFSKFRSNSVENTTTTIQPPLGFESQTTTTTTTTTTTPPIGFGVSNTSTNNTPTPPIGFGANNTSTNNTESRNKNLFSGFGSSLLSSNSNSTTTTKSNTSSLPTFSKMDENFEIQQNEKLQSYCDVIRATGRGGDVQFNQGNFEQSLRLYQEGSFTFNALTPLSLSSSSLLLPHSHIYPLLIPSINTNHNHPPPHTHSHTGTKKLENIPDTFEKKTELEISLNWGMSTSQLKLGLYSDVVNTVSKVLDRSPRFVDALVRRGEALRRLKRWQDSVNDFAKAMTMAPGNPDVLRGMRLGLEGLNQGFVQEDQEESSRQRLQKQRENLERLRIEKERQRHEEHERKLAHEARIQQLKEERLERERVRKEKERKRLLKLEDEKKARERRETLKREKELERLRKEKERKEKERKEKEKYVPHTSLLQPRDTLIEFLVNCLSNVIFLRATLIRLNKLDFSDVTQYDISLIGGKQELRIQTREHDGQLGALISISELREMFLGGKIVGDL